MNSLVLSLQFGVKRFKQYRKNLPITFKNGDKHAHRNPHAMPLEVKQKLLNAKKGGDWKKIREIERQSLTPFGRFAKHGFIFQRDKLPVYDIPNLEGFELQPYVEYLAPKLSRDLLQIQTKINQQKLQKLNSSSQLSDGSKSSELANK